MLLWYCIEEPEYDPRIVVVVLSKGDLQTAISKKIFAEQESTEPFVEEDLDEDDGDWMFFKGGLGGSLLGIC